MSCLVALAFANYEANVVSKSYSVQPDGFTIDLKLDDGQYQSQSGKLAGGGHGEDGQALNQQGSFGWTSPEGQEIKISYTADEYGYHPTGDAIPHL